MKFDKTYLNTQNRIELIEDYILHELKKSSVTNDVHAEEKIRDRISDRHAEVFATFKNRIRGDTNDAKKALSTFDVTRKWMLFHALSYGILYKKLFSCVGWNELSWQKVSLPYTALRFETKANFLHEINTQQPLFTDALNYAQAKYDRTKDDGFLRSQNNEYARTGAMARLYDPIICRKENSHYIIHDGTGRILTFCVKIILNQIDINTPITAWVGEHKKPTLRGRKIYTAARKKLFTMRRNAQMVSSTDKQKNSFRCRANARFQRTKQRLGLPAD